jgi:hypothetical protein
MDAQGSVPPSPSHVFNERMDGRMEYQLAFFFLIILTSFVLLSFMVTGKVMIP